MLVCHIGTKLYTFSYLFFKEIHCTENIHSMYKEKLQNVPLNQFQ